MKMLNQVLVLLAVIICTAVAAFGADVTAPITVAPIVAAPAATANYFQSAVAWMMGNQVVVGALIVAVFDFIFAINPQWKSNGALHFIYTAAQGKAGSNQPPVA